MNSDVFLYEAVPESERLAIIFSYRNAPHFAAYKTMQNAKVNRLFVRDTSQSWYNGAVQGEWENADVLRERLRAVVDRRGGGRKFDPANIVCMGASMGGYAAILFGCMLNVGKVVAFSPQISLDSRLPSNPHPDAMRHIKYLNVHRAIANAKNTSIDILFGSEDITDIYNIRNVHQYESISLFNVCGSPHNLLYYLAAHGVLSEIMVGYATTGQLHARLPLCTLHEDETVMALVQESVEAYYFHSPETAIVPLEKLVQTVPQWSAAHCWLGMARARANDDTGAAWNLREATNRLTQNERPFFELAAVLTRIAAYQEAEAAMLRAIQLAQKPGAPYHYRLGIIYMMQGKLGEAKKSQETAIALDKTKWGGKAEYQLGLISNKLGEHNQAIHHFENALALGDKSANLKKHLVTALYHAAPENFDHARARALCPDHPLLA